MTVAKVQRISLLAGLVGIVLFGAGALLARQDIAMILRAYLIGWNLWLGVALGCLAILMLQYLTGGAWGFVLRRLVEAGTQTLPLLAVLFLPILFGLSQLYPWVMSHDPALAYKQANYLNVPFFLARAAVYFAAWLALALLLNVWTDGPIARLRGLSAPGLVLYALAVTFASIDWVMSLEPHWYSSLFGVMYGVGQVLSGFAFIIAMAALLADRLPLAGVLGPDGLRDLGSLLLAFVMLWAYMSFSQFLLIWSGNLPEEIPWYLRRLRGGWQGVAAAMVLLQFVLPFLLLLSGDLKRSRRPLMAAAGLVFAARLIDLFWLIAPSHDDALDPASSPLRHGLEALLALAAAIGMGGPWLALFLWRLGLRELLPAGDMAPQEAPHHA